MYEIATAVALFAVSIPCWLFIYSRWLLPWIREDNIGALERGEIHIDPEWFDEVIGEIVKRTRHLFLADLGQLAHQSGTDQGALEGFVPDSGAGSGGLSGSLGALEPAAGFQAAEQLLRAVGMKKPPAMLVLKVAQALQGMLAQAGRSGAAPVHPAHDPTADPLFQ
jgi:hypothetical protein|tara:strand:- start:721 stop:1218 length:498 start_codon:yes stop_codon:yes gene_type:complete